MSTKKTSETNLMVKGSLRVSRLSRVGSGEGEVLRKTLRGVQKTRTPGVGMGVHSKTFLVTRYSVPHRHNESHLGVVLHVSTHEPFVSFLTTSVVRARRVAVRCRSSVKNRCIVPEKGGSRSHCPQSTNRRRQYY